MVQVRQLESEQKVKLESAAGRCPSAIFEIVIIQVLLAEPLGSLAFKMVQVRQLESEQKVKLESAAGRKNDRKVLVAEESNKNWADSDSDSSSSSSSSSDSEQEEVHCLMANQSSDDEIILFSGVLLSVILSEMASVFITNALQINFDSVLGIQDNDGMVNMFRALEATGLRGFLGCPSVLYEQELEKFFDTAMVQDGDITCAVSGKYLAISEDRFVGVFNLPTDGLTDLSEVPNHLVLQARTVFSKSEKPVQYSCKKRLLKYQFRLLNDILAKSITVKAGSFDAVTHERFLMMTAIHFGVKINWIKILFDVLKEMVDRTIKRAKGFAAQICVLLKGDPAVTLGEEKTFPTLKILSEKTVNTYVATNKTIDSRGESDEPHVDKVAIVKRKSISKKKSAPNDKKDADEEPVEVVEKAVSKKRSASTGDEPAVTKKKRTTKKKAALSKASMELVSVAQDVEPISIVPAERPHKRTSPKRTLRLSAGSDDEIVAKEPAVEEIIEKEQEASTADDVDQIIARIITETGEMETEEIFVETDAGKSDETTEATEIDVVLGKADIEEPVEPRSEDIIVEISEESMSIEDLLQQIPGDALLPSVFAAEPTKIKFINGISIPGVEDGDLYKESLPKIALADKGKAALVEAGVVKGPGTRDGSINFWRY
ncbi:hypothetical protein F511_23334 [Dorcoceras hygrometricum]|uniref:Splicing factor 3B subunit 1-like n=1 Tax=Dorcoceras hygrometricum TaxID=472368 RepID=A0A2Z7AGN2_9LAMI|nr:hypothetical protein F511_23334 [Dorcoceras hygrometricum]